MPKLEELMIIAQNISYIEPSSQNSDEWTSDELIYKSIHISLHNEIQIRAGLHMCNKFPPLKLVYKHILSGYINFFTDLNTKIVSSQSTY